MPSFSFEITREFLPYEDWEEKLLNHLNKRGQLGWNLVDLKINEGHAIVATRMVWQKQQSLQSP